MVFSRRFCGHKSMAETPLDKRQWTKCEISVDYHCATSGTLCSSHVHGPHNGHPELVSLQSSSPPDQLEKLRAKLDRLDAVLLDVLRERIRCCEEIAGVKRRDGVPMMQPSRLVHVHRRAAEYGASNDVNPDFLSRLYDLILNETCRVESLIINAKE
jgi:4-amino-4-deoxychorismate mutase